MTPTQRRAHLEAIGWSQRGLADRLGWDERTVRRWCAGTQEPPPEVDSWLARLAECHRENPPPVRGDGRKR